MTPPQKTPTQDVGEFDHRATRRDFVFGELHRSDLLADPVLQLEQWLNAAKEAGNFDATAMCLSTATKEGRPSARYVLLKHLDTRGLCFYTDSRSRKGQELAENPFAALTFYWPEMDRQVRVTGRIERLPDADNEAYFNQRPIKSRIAAVASHQSQPIESRAALEERFKAVETEFPEQNVPRNPAWGGYRLMPDEWEFWQGRRSRLHDRFVYTPEGEGWQVQRLMP
ncbi:pyridoxamine 5'-phosphate oxidase [Halothiobacillus neapolitanus]|uniref:Pyridoxine/pyridoxamine 5'-phosphate oxidase n=1 Tax=Halothiobacillus neapolitanus (strain ATCC 23641 / DSM 15147 / CIP 104769 / NCIMB 8539 / c2) TaxID=555778 RepID=D0KW66_HALNC|nr:pyridoxamine 5'-phosphate oxidase [Halothiobacillus neapolitanus c2]TDN59812.1 pyridoxamine 5'-phosphate oxidase [Halothiobacillus neapolitanus]